VGCPAYLVRETSEVGYKGPDSPGTDRSILLSIFFTDHPVLLRIFNAGIQTAGAKLLQFSPVTGGSFNLEIHFCQTDSAIKSCQIVSQVEPNTQPY